MPKRKIKWSNGDVFAIPLSDGRFAIGQILDLMMVNQVRVALYDESASSLETIKISNVCQPENLISLVASTREQLDYNVWKIIGNRPITIQIERYPNEQFRSKHWVGAKLYDAALVEDFLEAFHALRPWNNWFNPNYLDAFLIDLSKKPKQLVLIKEKNNGLIIPKN